MINPRLRCFLAGSAMCGLVAASPAAWGADSAPVSLPRDGAWLANYDDDSCQLLGKFGTGKSAISAIFTRYQPSEGFDLMLQGESLKRSGNTAKVKLAFGPGQPERVASADLGTLADKPLMMFSGQRLDSWTWPLDRKDITPPPVTPAQEAAVSTLTVGLGGSRSYRLELGSMGKPMATMRDCMDGLLKFWGYDPAAIATQSRRATPLGNPGSWVTTNDYPSKAVMMGHNGLLQFRLDLDEAGKVLRCHILARTNPDDFADIACRALAKRARFEPALDAAGKPMKSFYMNKVRFVIPG